MHNASGAQPERTGWWGSLVGMISGRLRVSYQRRALTLLLLLLAIDAADRALISSLGPTLEHVFHLSNAQLGLIASAFAYVSAAASIPMGMLADRVKRTALIAISLILWVGAEGLTGAAISFAMLFGVRLLLGIVSATSGPTLPSMVGDLVPGGQRGRALGFVNSGQLIGIAVGFVLPVILLPFTSFRWCFWVLAITGGVLSFLFFRLPEPKRVETSDDLNEAVQNPTRSQEIVEEKHIEPSQRAVLTRDPRQMSIWAAVIYVFRVRTDIIVLIGRSIGDFFFQGITTFAVVFATGWYGISQGSADLAFLVIGIGALVGVLLIGRFADRLLRSGKLNSRLWLGAVGYILAPFALLPALVTHSLLLALPLFALGAFFLEGAGPPLDAVRIDVLVPRLRGRAEAVRQVVRTAAEGGAPIVVGVLSGYLAGGGTRGLELAFLVLLPFLLVNGLVLLFALRTYQPDVAAAFASLKIEASHDTSDEKRHG